MQWRKKVLSLEKEVKHLKANLDLKNASAFLSNDIVCKNLRILQTILTSPAFDSGEQEAALISSMLRVRPPVAPATSYTPASCLELTRETNTFHQILPTADTSPSHCQLFTDPPCTHDNTRQSSLQHPVSPTDNVHSHHSQSSAVEQSNNQICHQLSHSSCEKKSQENSANTSSLKPLINECIFTENKTSSGIGNVLTPSLIIKHEALYHTQTDSCGGPQSSSPSKPSATASASISSGSTKTSHICGVCHRSFTHLGLLNTHKCPVYADIKPRVGAVLQSRFVEAPNLRRHRGVIKRTHQCNICQKTFKSLSYMAIHSRFHSGEKPFQCDVCHKSFTTSSNLSDHKRIHSGETPYQCNMCHKVFKTSSSLGAHKRTHSRLKPHHCDRCYKSFKSFPNLKKHKCVMPHSIE